MAAASSSTSEVEENEYEVEEILEKRITNDKLKYLVKWKGYSSDNNTWEPIVNLATCIQLVEKFEIDEHNKKRKKEKDAAGGDTKRMKTTDLSRYGSQYSKIINGELIPEKIFGVKKVKDELHFLTRIVHSDTPQLIPSGLARTICPNLILDFYERNLSWEDKKSSNENKENKGTSSNNSGKEK